MDDNNIVIQRHTLSPIMNCEASLKIIPAIARHITKQWCQQMSRFKHARVYITVWSLYYGMVIVLPLWNVNYTKETHNFLLQKWHLKKYFIQKFVLHYCL